jgi:hypothetical protein
VWAAPLGPLCGLPPALLCISPDLRKLSCSSR